MSLLVLVPTRRRRASAERLIAACEQTGATADFLLITNDDDGSYDGIALPGNWDQLRLPPLCLSEKLNAGAAYGLSEGYQAIAFVSDDQVPVTPRWDKALLGAATGGWAYPDIGGHDDLPECVAIDARIIEALGWFAHPGISHYWLDNVWADLGNATGRLRYLKDVHVEHRHYSRGLAEHDSTYALAESSGEHDANAYKDWREKGGKDRDVATLRQLLGG